MNEKKVWFITGSSTGIGRELAEEALRQCYLVAATARKPEMIQDLVEKYPDAAIALRLDVTEPEEVRTAIAAAVAKFGRLDVLVNNAAYGLSRRLKKRRIRKSERNSKRICSARLM